MDQAIRTTMLAEEFLAWEAEQDRKWEFDGFQPIEMNGVTIAHSKISVNLLLALASRLRGTPFNVLGPDLKVQIGSRYRYPDALISSAPLQPDARIVMDPVILFEVLSDSTSRTDWVDKMVEYRSLPSVQRYVLLDQAKARVTSISRAEPDWVLKTLGLADTLALAEIGLTVPISELYEGLDLP